MTQNELMHLIESGVRKTILEYADTEKGQSALGKAAKRAAFKGNDSVYHDAVKTIDRNKFKSAKDAKNARSNFQKSFEECGDLEEEEIIGDSPANDLVGEGRVMTVTQSELKNMVREGVYLSLNRVLNEVRVGQESLHGYYGRGKNQKDRAAQDWRKMFGKRAEKAIKMQRGSGNTEPMVDMDILGDKGAKNALRDYNNWEELRDISKKSI